MTATATHETASAQAAELLKLHLCKDVGPIRLRNLLDRFGSPAAVLDASQAELQRAEGIGGKTAQNIRSARSSDDAAREIELAGEHGVRILCTLDPDYPAPLRSMPDPPTCLYVKGTLLPTDAVSLAIVGTRRCSHYGLEQAMRFGSLLAGAGFTVISGLALGIDGEAHRGALRAKGRTLAVLGNGLSTVYPPKHSALADEVAAGGALLSEYPMTAAPEAGNFPKRNRIIAGLSLGTLVVEAGRTSGALITARVALDYNREVFAIPGRIDASGQTAGANSLIREGAAKLVTCLEDILDELPDVGDIMKRGVSQASQPGAEGAPADASGPGPAIPLGAEEQSVLGALIAGDRAVDDICRRTTLPAARVLAALTKLRLAARVTALPGGRFAPRGQED